MARERSAVAGVEVITPAFWCGKRVLLTGHTGFKGAWLASWLVKLGAKVHGYSLPPSYSPNVYGASGIVASIEETVGDIRSIDALRTSITCFQPEVIFHLAAQPLVRFSYEHPVETFETNVMGTVNLLQAARSCRELLAVIVVTTDKCYQNRELKIGYTESDPLGGHDPYSASKACAELVAQSWYQSFLSQSDCESRELFGLATARAGNVIGGGDMAVDRVVPDVLRSVTADSSVHIRNPNAIRPWQYVLDPLGGYLCLAESVANEPRLYSGPWNFGPGEDDVQPVGRVVERLLTRLGADTRWSYRPEPSLHETHSLLLDCSKAKAELGWSPQYSLEEALESVVRWQDLPMEEASHRGFIEMEIDRYMNRVGSEAEC